MRTFIAVWALLLIGRPSAGASLDWGPEERLTVAGTVSETGLNHGALAADSWGRLTAAWAEQDGPDNNFRVHSRTQAVDGSWGPAEIAVDFHPGYAGSGLGAKFSSLVFLPGDTLLLVWHDYRVAGINNLELFTKVRAPGTAWGDSASEQRLTTSMHPESKGDNSYLPNVALDPAGTAHVAWYDYRFDGDNAEILFKSRLGGAWDVAPGDGPDENASMSSGDSNFPALAAGPGGSLHLAWRDNSDGSFRIRYRRRTPGGVWTDDAVLSPPGVPADGVDLAADQDGTLIVVWADSREGGKAVFSRERSPAGAWGPPVRVSPGGAGAEEPAVAVDDSGRRHATWQDARVSLFNREIWHQSVPAGVAWDSTGATDVRVSDGSGKSSRPTLLLHAGRVFVLWQDARHGADEIYFRAAARANTSVAGGSVRNRVRAFPNPFRSRVRLEGTPEAIRDVLVMDVTGRMLAVLDRETMSWDGRDAAGRETPPGVYFFLGGDGVSWTRLGRAVRVR